MTPLFSAFVFAGSARRAPLRLYKLLLFNCKLLYHRTREIATAEKKYFCRAHKNICGNFSRRTRATAEFSAAIARRGRKRCLPARPRGADCGGRKTYFVCKKGCKKGGLRRPPFRFFNKTAAKSVRLQRRFYSDGSPAALCPARSYPQKQRRVACGNAFTATVRPRRRRG